MNHVPEVDFFNDWFINAYGILSHSSNENGLIPLSELKCYEESFGLIGSFKEFVMIIYAINDSYSKHRQEKLNPKQQVKIE